MAETKIRVMVVDDHMKVHRVIGNGLSMIPDIVVVAHASDGEEALEQCAEKDIDVILMDVLMSGMGGIDSTRLIHEQYPDIKILALSSYDDFESVRTILDAGAVGYVLKDGSMDDLARTIRMVRDGMSVLSPEITAMLLNPPHTRAKRDYGLTPREMEVLALMAEGLNNPEIADRLFVSVSTAKFHVSSVLGKLGVSSRVEAVATAIEEHLLP